MKKAILSTTITLLLSLAAWAGSVPSTLVGRWVNGSTSALSYWGTDGSYVGHGRGTGQVYEFDADGHYRCYTVIEMRSYGMLTKVLTSSAGTVSFEGNSFTLHAGTGHYHSEWGSKVTDRDMTADDLAKASKSYNYRVEGNTFVIPFDDGSSLAFERLK